MRVRENTKEHGRVRRGERGSTKEYRSVRWRGERRNMKEYGSVRGRGERGENEGRTREYVTVSRKTRCFRT